MPAGARCHLNTGAVCQGPHRARELRESQRSPPPHAVRDATAAELPSSHSPGGNFTVRASKLFGRLTQPLKLLAPNLILRGIKTRERWMETLTL